MATKRKHNTEPVDIICIGPAYTCPYGLRESKCKKISKRPKKVPMLKSDDDGRLIYKIGDNITDKYEILGTVGSGSYGTVLEVLDRDEDDVVAMKVVRNTDECHKDAVKEVQCLEKLKRLDPECKYFCMHMYDAFCIEGHICIVVEMLGPNLHAFMRKYRKTNYNIDEVRHIGYQVCTAVNFLHENGFIHNDIKPGNIAFTCTELSRPFSKNEHINVCNTDIRLLDFGSITTELDLFANVATTRVYSAPERLLDIPPTYAYDVWAVGCTLFELYTGHVLFETDKEVLHLAMIEQVLGKVPIHMTCRSNLFKNGKLKLDRRTKVARDLRESITKLTDHQTTNTKEERDLFELMKNMLTIDPAARLSMKQVIEHAFFHKVKEKLN